MIDQNTDFFKIEDNFAKTAHVPSKCIIESRLDFEPQITIAIPTFKRPDLLREALDSALNQIDYSNYEVIVVDNNPERDCDTETMMMTYANNERISYFKNDENLGMAGNWNRLFTLAKGKFVVMLHDDDVIFSNFLKECVSVLLKHNNIAILKPKSYKWWMKDNVNLQNVDFSENDTLKLNRLFDISNYGGYLLGPPSGCFFDKEKVKKIGGFNIDYYPSIDYFFVVLFSKYFEVYNYDKTLSLYRYDSNETLKKTTLDNHIIQDVQMINMILRKCFVPKNFRIAFLTNRINEWNINNRKYFFEDYHFESTQIKTINWSNKKLLLFKRMINFYMRLLIYARRIKTGAFISRIK